MKTNYPTPHHTIAAAIAKLNQSDREYFEERAAIREYDGNQDRITAERGAVIDLSERNKP